MITLPGRITRLVLVMAASTAALAACATKPAGDGIGFREARFNEMSAIRNWQSCRDQAVELDKQAHDEGSPARYLASAKLVEKCEADVGGDAARISSDERMRAYALAVQDYFKGGDIPKSRETLDKLKANFPGNDFYYANGASFIDTMEFLTGVRDRNTPGELGISNVDEGFRAELLRARYWKKN
jgi:hypothetical protein